jgi:hypothetical protein
MTLKHTATRNHDVCGTLILSMDRTWDTQPKPYKQPLEFRLTKAYLVGFSGYDSCGPGYSAVYVGDGTHAYNSAYGSMKQQLGDPSTWANNLLEADQALGMMASRLGQLGQFTKSLGKGNFASAAKALKMAAAPPGVSKKKSFSDNFLEYHFGWSPMCNDIGSAMNTLQKTDFGGRYVRARGSDTVNDSTETRQHSNGAKTWALEYNRTTWRAQLGAHIRVSNPNAYLANQMGFVNPLSVAWEAVPYSFVVDWFANVGDVLSSFSDFVGLEVLSSYNTVSSEGSTILSSGYEADQDRPDLAVFNFARSSSSIIFDVNRSKGIPGPSLEVLPFKGLSFTRGVTACALLLQKLR